MSKAIDVRNVAASAYWGEEHARVIVAAWHASGETLSAFARRYHVDRRRVARWAGRLEASTPVRFHSVRVTQDAEPRPSAHAIEIELPNGARIRVPHGFEAEDLRRLLSVLEAGSSC